MEIIVTKNERPILFSMFGVGAATFGQSAVNSPLNQKQTAQLQKINSIEF